MRKLNHSQPGAKNDTSQERPQPGYMKVGLVRHCEISASTKRFCLNSEEFTAWVKNYESSKLKIGQYIKPFSGWHKCISSSSTRTFQTAELLYGSHFDKTDLIVEIPIAPVFKTSLRLPLIFWLVAGRLAWLVSHKSQPESMQYTVQRVKLFISNLLSSGDTEVLVVSHGFIMSLIRKELLSNGFKGEKFFKAKHGRLYIYER